jgi:hypothetical protein
MATPYTYLIGWTKHHKFYYGVRFSKNCDPKSIETKMKMSLAKQNSFGANNNFYGKTHTEEYKKKKSEHQKIAQLGSSNSNAGTWKIQFPDGNINIITCLKEFSKNVGISVYRLKNNKSGYILLEKL